VEARRFDGSYKSALEIYEWANPREHGDVLNTDYFARAPITMNHAEALEENEATFPRGWWLTIRTFEGDRRADAGDWVIRGIQGEFYPCKPRIFERTYEPAPE
jgi:hypothetical protein